LVVSETNVLSRRAPALSDTAPPRVPARLRPVLETALRIRAFEHGLLDLFKKGQLFGTVHTCIGQELCAAALHPHLKEGVDAFFATHRGHGHYLAYGGPADSLLAEIMGREGALCLGRGGTQNLCYNRFFSSGIQGGSTPLATGFAWALKRRGENGIVVAQIGDGTLGEGTVYEAFTFAVLLQAPVLFLLEYNGWAQSTDTRLTTPGDLLQRAAGFGLEAHRIEDDDPVQLHEHLGKVVERVRRGRPFLQIIDTRRLMAHSKGDDNRSPELIESLWQGDPLSRLVGDGSSLQAAQARIDTEIKRLIDDVSSRAFVPPTDAPALPPSATVLTSSQFCAEGQQHASYGRVVEELNRGLHEVMAESRDVLLIGEDLNDPYGGAFKVSRGLSTAFPDQVFSTPIAEATIVGVSNGLALAGMRPVAELMFGDFVTLATDQLVNFAAKFHYMYGARVTCPITVRLVSGGGRGYGPTHSQSLERLFCGIPGLRVVALSQRHDPAGLLRHAVLADDSPKVFVENKLLYALRPAVKPPIDLRFVPLETRNGDYAALQYIPARGAKPDVTVVTYGGMTGPTEAAMQKLIEEDELSFDYFVLTQLWPLDVSAITDSVRRTRRLVVIEDSTAEFGVGSAVIAGVAQALEGGFACRAVGARPVPIPSARQLEEQVLPSAETVAAAIAATRTGRQ
jgi:2-oxoisovalerate dehydrogenase E1 component